ncbi:TPA: hypothetical protein ACGUT0_003730, partial [Vibrio vulnificus]
MKNKNKAYKLTHRFVIAGWLQVVFIVGCQDSGDSAVGDSAVIDDSANYVYLNGERLINEYGGAYQKIQG